MKKTIIFGNHSKIEDDSIFVTSNNFQKTVKNDESIISALDEIVKFHDKEFEGISLPNLLVYRDVPILWLFWGNLRKMFIELNSFIMEFSNFVDQENPKLTKIEDDFKYFNIIKQICSEKKIELKYSRSDYSKFQLIKKINFNKIKYGTNFLQQNNFRNRKKLHNTLSKENTVDLDNRVIFVISPYLRRDIINLKSQDIERGEDLLQNVITMVQKKNSILCVEPLYHVRAKQDILKERLESEFPWIPLEILFVKKNIKAKKEFLDNYIKIITSKKFQSLFELRDIKIGKEVEKLFLEMSFAFFLPSWLDLIDSLSTIFSTNKPKCIILPHEQTAIAQIFITICKKFNIPTIGIEHGVSASYGYSYARDRLIKSKNNLMFPIPKKQLAFGKITREILIKSGFNADDVLIFGNPNYFYLDKLKKILSEKNLFSKFGIDKQKKIILFTTSGREDYYDKKIWKYLLDYFHSKDEFKLILKPHPSDNPLIYESMIKETKSINAKIIYKNFYEVLYISTILVSGRSTTISDAMVFGKPVIEVKFGKKLSWIIDNYQNGIMVSGLDNLGENVLKFVNDKNLQLIMNKKNEQLVKDLYNIPEENPEEILEKLLF